MNTYTLHITLYDLFFVGMIFVGLNFAVLLFFVKSVNRAANRFLALALVIMILWMVRILAIDVRLQSYFYRWDWLPMQFLLALGPLIYFYVLKITRPEYKFRWKDLLHFSPLLLEQAAQVFEIKESNRTGADTYATQTFALLNPVLQLLIFISLITYLYRSHRVIENFYRRLQPILMDRSRLEFRWLRRLLAATALLWLLWIAYAGIDYFDYSNQLGVHFYYLFYIFFAVIIIWTAAAAFLQPQAGMTIQQSPAVKPSPSAGLKQKGIWLKKAMEAKLFYQDPDLSLRTLAEKLNLNPNDLSRVINTAFGKNFNDFINEYRIWDVTRKMQDPAYDRMTLLGIAMDAGFNSKSTFNRTFKQLTGKSPAEYKSWPEKERPSYTLRPYSHFPAIISYQQTTLGWSHEKLNRNYMFRNYLKIAWRNIVRNKASSFINIGGLAVGMAVAMLIGLWIWDEILFDRSNQNYDRIVQVMAYAHVGGGLVTQSTLPLPVSTELRNKYGSDFNQVASTITFEQNINYGSNAFLKTGCYAEPAIANIITLHMVQGAKVSLKTPNTMLISESLAQTIFGNTNAIGKVITVNNANVLQVTGVYKDIPQNTQFGGVNFIAPVSLLFQNGGDMNNWYSSSFQTYALLNKGADIRQLSNKIQNILYEHSQDAAKPSLFLFPMSQWHLYEFKNGNVVAGRLQFVRLFGITGIFVLLLACINFMNLSTARSEKRAKEVGISKAIGSLRGQLVGQFMGESLMTVTASFMIALALVYLALPFFNRVSGKQLHMVWNDPLVWLTCFCFCLFTGLIAGSYPAVYLSSFKPVKVLKGTFKTGRTAAIPRKVLVVTQFTISVTLVIATIVVFKQIQFAKDRPIGYNRSNLVSIPYNDIKGYSAFRDELLRTGAISGVSASSNATTGISSSADNLSWKGKDPNRQEVFGTILVDTDFGSVVGWQMKEGRNFSTQFLSDSSGFLFNEAAIKQMGLKDPIGETVKWHGRDWKVLGVVKDMIMTSPFDPITPVVFLMDTKQRSFNVINLKLKSGIPATDALSKTEAIFRKFAPAAPFNYKFADNEYAQKFAEEERTGKLASVFAALAIFISCLGLFGVASFVAEQRVKEIGIRKVLGASVLSIWGSLSKDFVILVIISLLIATPASYYLMHRWLQHFTYRTALSWWVFASTGSGVVIITLLTVSYHSIKAALTNPVKSLRNE